MLSSGELYREQGAGALRQRDQDRIRRRAIGQLEKLGLKEPLKRFRRPPDGTLSVHFRVSGRFGGEAAA